VAKSNKAWLRRHVSDPYVRKAKAQGYRSRAAFKLLELDEREKLLRPGMSVVDLGAAPGGWAQVAAKKVAPGGRVIAIDLLEIAPISGVTVLRGDFRETGIKAILEALAGRPADGVLSDVWPNMSGIGNVDQARALELTGAAIDFCRQALKREGFFLVKAFHGEAFGEITLRLKKTFKRIKVIKPSASRGESSETYVLARGLL
jgi:23S rRNA (uridine2552-2'-O)-methyltransferase